MIAQPLPALHRSLVKGLAGPGLPLARKLATWLWLTIALALCAPAQAQISLRDDRGTAVSLAGAPARIVSLLPSLTESLCALDGCARLVGVDRYSNWPPSVRSLPQLGGMDDALIERIVSLKPDLVLAAPSTRAVERLESLGLKVLVFESKSHGDVQRTLVQLAAVLGRPLEASRVWDRIEDDLQRAAAQVPAALRGQRVYFEIGDGPYAAGASSFIGQTLQRLGLGNIVPADQGPFPKLNPEFVVRAQPDIIMAARRSIADMPRRPGWSSLQALQRKQVCGFDTEANELLVRPGPRMGTAALQLAHCLADLVKASP